MQDYDALLLSVPTPYLLVDKEKVKRNCERMRAKTDSLSVKLRPHMKTCKSVDVARLAVGKNHPITVSTIAEAYYFFEQGGYSDILYAVSFAAHKLNQCVPLLLKGCSLTLIVDTLVGAQQLAAEAARLRVKVPVLVEVDCGDARGGLPPDSEELLSTAKAIHSAGSLILRGVLTHGGQSYKVEGAQALAAIAEHERKEIVRAADRLRRSGLPCPVVSAGSTPTATHFQSGEGITELRAGVYVFQDMDQAGIGSCSLSDIALVLCATVIGHNKAANRIIIDAGGLALSKDLSASKHASMEPTGLGFVLPLNDDPIPSSSSAYDFFVQGASQEHGQVAWRDETKRTTTPLPFDAFPIGSRVRVLPNHACYLAAAHQGYCAVDSTKKVMELWGKCNFWYSKL